MDNEKQITDIVAMLDQFMANGGGHMNIKIENAESDSINIDTSKSSDCSAGNMACSVPTLIECIDENFKEEKNK